MNQSKPSKAIREFTTAELEAELERRQKQEDPTWFIRDLVHEGHDLDTPEFEAATDWMDDPSQWKEF